MFTGQLHPDHELIVFRERHARLRADAERARHFRAARGRHRFRSRHRRT